LTGFGYFTLAYFHPRYYSRLSTRVRVREFQWAGTGSVGFSNFPHNADKTRKDCSEEKIPNVVQNRPKRVENDHLGQRFQTHCQFGFLSSDSFLFRTKMFPIIFWNILEKQDFWSNLFHSCWESKLTPNSNFPHQVAVFHYFWSILGYFRFFPCCLLIFSSLLSPVHSHSTLFDLLKDCFYRSRIGFGVDRSERWWGIYSENWSNESLCSTSTRRRQTFGGNYSLWLFRKAIFFHLASTRGKKYRSAGKNHHIWPRIVENDRLGEESSNPCLFPFQSSDFLSTERNWSLMIALAYFGKPVFFVYPFFMLILKAVVF